MYHPTNFGLKQIKTVKVVPWWFQLSDPKVATAVLTNEYTMSDSTTKYYTFEANEH